MVGGVTGSLLQDAHYRLRGWEVRIAGAQGDDIDARPLFLSDLAVQLRKQIRRYLL